MAELEIKFPNGETKKFEQGNPVVVLGANGAGKTRLSVEIEELNDQSFRHAYDSSRFLVHRLSAQKSLAISTDLVIKGVEASEREAYVGNANDNAFKLGHKYQGNPATYLANDYDKALSLLFAKDNKLLEQHNRLDRECVLQHRERPVPLTTLAETAEEIWANLLPNKRIDLSGNEVHAIGSNRYHGKEMSDGERVILYMIIQALSVKENTLIIVDEPELHIHKAILNKLWDKLEAVRQDCVFMYLTHDLDFAVSRNVDEVIWVKSFDGIDKWAYEFLKLANYSDLPEGLLFEVIGTQKKIAFVEGNKNSIDYLIYQEILKDKNYHVIPCGGCSEVIRYVKAKKGYSEFDHIEVYGIIDRDSRADNEIESLKTDGILVLEVAEVENLLVVPELLAFMQQHLGRDPRIVNEVEDLVVNKIYKGQMPKQIQEAFVKGMNHEISVTKFGQDSDMVAMRRILDEAFSLERITAVYESMRSLFEKASGYKDVLRIFNYKELCMSIDSKFGLLKGQYRQTVINLLKKSGTAEVRKRIVEAIMPYIPNLP